MDRRHAIATGLGGLAAIAGLPRQLLARPAARPGLDVATAAARWIATSRSETKAGLAWPTDPLKPGSVSYDLYNGMPGVVLFHLELHKATGDARWLDEARGGANELIAQIPMFSTERAYGLYTGLAGAAFVLEETHRVTGEGRYRDAARRAMRLVRERGEKSGPGLAWGGQSTAYDIVSGSSGIGLTLLWAERTMQDKDARATAVAAGRHLLSVGVPAAGGTKWAMMATLPRMYPNFSHGTAGVAYFLASLHQLTGDRAFLDGALAGARYLQAIADKTNGGFKVFHSEPGNEYLYYLSWCHGPAGTSRLFYRLAQATQDDRWLDLVKQGARATIDAGIPEERTPGFWNNVGQCCGNCGVGEYFLTLNRIMPTDEHARMVRRAADDTLQRATEDRTGMRWVQAEHRVRPNLLVAQTGWMQGASGIGAFFLHADHPKSATTWPDSPFEEAARS
jgi:lantibiotic modifying enzyme